MVAVAGAVVGLVVTFTLAGGDDFTFYFHDDATLRFPIGYRNAEAAFMLICFWPTIVLAAEGRIPWQLRALAIGIGTRCSSSWSSPRAAARCPPRRSRCWF